MNPVAVLAIIILSNASAAGVWESSHGAAFICPAVAAVLVIAVSLDRNNLRMLGLACIAAQILSMLAIALVP